MERKWFALLETLIELRLIFVDFIKLLLVLTLRSRYSISRQTIQIQVYVIYVVVPWALRTLTNTCT